MNLFAKLYRDVPAEQKDALLRFRAAHPPRIFEREGRRWRYFVGGGGAEWLVVMHGGGGNAESLFRQIALFERHYRVLAPTYPANVHTVATAIDDLLALSDSLGIARAHWYGISMGGAAAQEIARKRPALAASMILSHTAPPTPFMGRALQRRLRLMRWLPEWVVLQMGQRRLRGRLELAADSVPLDERAFWQAFRAELYATSLGKADVIARTNLQIDYHLNYHYRPEDLAGWPGRVLIVESDEDQNVPPVAQETLKALYPRAQVHTFRGIGHSGGLVLTEANVALVEAFLAGDRDEQ